MTGDADRDLERLLTETERLRPLARALAHGGDADDLIQATVEVAMRARPADDRKLQPWLTRVLRNVARMRARGEVRRRARELQAEGAEGSLPPDAVVARAEQRRAVVDAVLRLPEPARRTVLLRYLEGWSCARIARDEGVAAATVRARLKRALDAVRDDLARRWGPDWRSHCLALGGVRAVGAAQLVGAAALFLVVAWVWWKPQPALDMGPDWDVVAMDPRAAQTDPDGKADKPVRSDAGATVPGRRDGARRKATPNPVAPKSERMRVRVIHAERGEPVAGAEILTASNWATLRRNSGWMASATKPWFEQHLPPQTLPLAVTDAEGWALLDLPLDDEATHTQPLLARTGALRGLVDVEAARLPRPGSEPGPMREIEIPVYLDFVVDVRVAGPTNEPAPGVAVALVVRSSGSSERPFARLPRIASTDSKGRSRMIVDGQSMAEWIERADELGHSLALEAVPLSPGTPGRPVAVAWDESRWRGSVALRCDHTGVLEVELENVPPDPVVTLRMKSGARPGRTSTPVERASYELAGRLHGTTRATFGNLPLGRTFVIEIASRREHGFRAHRLLRTVAGPTRKATAASVSVDSSSGTWLRGRLVMPDASPCPLLRARASLVDSAGRPVRGLGTVQLDDAGNFAIRLDEYAEAHVREGNPIVDPRIDALVLRDAGSGPRVTRSRSFAWPGAAVCRVQADILRNGSKLGAIEAGTAPLMTAGRVLEADGSPASGLRVFLSAEWRHALHPDQIRWDGDRAETITDEAGRFRFADFDGMGTTLQDTGRYRLRVGGLERDCTRGDTDLALRLPAKGTFRFGYRLPESPMWVQARLVPAHEGARSHFFGTLLESESESGRIIELETDQAPAGPCELEFAFIGWLDTVQRTRFGPFRVRTGTLTAPPEVQDLDLASLIRATRLEVVDEARQPVDPRRHRASMSLFRPAPGATTPAGSGASRPVPGFDGNYLLFHDAINALAGDVAEDSVLLTIDGYRPVAVRDLLRDQRIEVQARPRLRLRVQGAPSYDDGSWWDMELHWLDAPTGVTNTRFPATWKDDRSEVTVPGLGKYALHWSVHPPDGEARRHVEHITFPESGQRDFKLIFPAALFEAQD